MTSPERLKATTRCHSVLDSTRRSSPSTTAGCDGQHGEIRAVAADLPLLGFSEEADELNV